MHLSDKVHMHTYFRATVMSTIDIGDQVIEGTDSMKFATVDLSKFQWAERPLTVLNKCH